MKPQSAAHHLGKDDYAGYNGYASTLALAWLLVVVALIAARFWDYWSTLLP